MFLQKIAIILFVLVGMFVRSIIISFICWYRSDISANHFTRVY